MRDVTLVPVEEEAVRQVTLVPVDESPDPAVVGIASEADRSARGEVDYLRGNLGSVVKPVPALATAQALKGMGGLARQAGELTGMDALAGKGRQWADEARLVEEQIGEEHPLRPESWAGSVRSGLTSTYMQGPFMAAGAGLVRAGKGGAGLIASLAPMVGITEGEAYERFRERGHGPGTASAGAAVEGAIEAGTEMLPMGEVLRLASPASRQSFQALLRGFLKYGGEEFAGEALATLGQDLTDKVMAVPGASKEERLQRVEDYFTKVNPQTGNTEAFDNFKATMIATGTQTALMGGLGMAAGATRGRGMQPEAAPPAEPAPVVGPGAAAEPAERLALPAPAVAVTPQGTAILPEQVSAMVNQRLASQGMSAEQIAESRRKLAGETKPSGPLSRAVAKGGMAPAAVPTGWDPRFELEQDRQAYEQGGDDDLSEVRQEAGGAQTVPPVRGEAVDIPGAEEYARLDEVQPLPTPLDANAHDAATSPANDRPEPTEAQKKAGNYKVGRIKLHGLDISIENPAGSVRKGVDETGREWQTELQSHYGYLKGTLGRDKDHLDVFVKPGIDQSTAGDKVFVVDQVDPKTGQLDEHKVLMGFATAEEARAGYLANYDHTGAQRIGAITEATVPEFKGWLKEGDTKSAFAGQAGTKGTAGTEGTAAPAKLSYPALKRQALAAGLNVSPKQQDGSFIITAKADGAEIYRAASLAEVRDHLAGAGKKVDQVPDAGKTMAPAAKQSWQMTRDEWAADYRESFWRKHGVEIDASEEALTSYHRDLVLDAIGAKKAIPAAVLAEYPDIKHADSPKPLHASSNRESGERVKPVASEEAKPLSIGDEFEHQGTRFRLDDVNGEVWAEDIKTSAMERWKSVKEFEAATGQRINFGENRTETKPAAEPAKPQPERAEPETKAETKPADRGPHFAAGYAAFKEGKPRTLPSYFANATGKNPKDWFRGWDAANLAEPVRDEEAEKPEPKADLASSKAEPANTVFTEDAYQKAKALLKKKLASELRSGIDPELMQAGFTIAGYHIEKGSRKFVNYAAAMIEDFGDKIKPYLKAFYNGVRDLPGIEGITGEMDSYQAVAGYDVERFTPEGLKKQLEYEEPEGESKVVAGAEKQEKIRAFDLKGRMWREVSADHPRLRKNASDSWVIDEEILPAASAKAPQHEESPATESAPAPASAAIPKDWRNQDHKPEPTFKKGDRIQAPDGRHGEISQASSFTMRTIILGGSGVEGGAARYDHLYTARWDNGVEESVYDFQPETDPAPKVAPAPQVDGKAFDPQRLLDSIKYDKDAAANARAAASRAKKPEMIREHKARAERNDKSAAAKQAAFDGWAEKYPEEAARYRPTNIQLAAPPASESTGQEKEPESAIKMSLKETTHAKKGHKLFVVTMDERVERDVYDRLNSDAKRTGNGYSSFRGHGAIPGFQFLDRESAENFKAKWSGTTAEAAKPAGPELAANEVQPADSPYIYTKEDGDWYWRHQSTKRDPLNPGNLMEKIRLDFQDKLETLLAEKGGQPAVVEPTAEAEPKTIWNDDGTSGPVLITAPPLAKAEKPAILEETEEEDHDRPVAAADREDGGAGAEGEGAADVPGAEAGREAADVPGRDRAGDGGLVSASLRGSLDEDPRREEPAGVRGAGAEPAPGAARDLGRDPGDLAGILRSDSPGDLRIPVGGLTRTGSWKATASRNLDIITLIRTLEEEKRPATLDEQRLLMLYTGWGAGEIRNKLFPGYAQHGRLFINWAEPDWKPLVERVESLLSADDLKTAARSSQYAHYTSEAVTRSIWSALQRLGFAGGKVFEPGMGTGNFMGTMPDGIYAASKYTGIEFDNLTAAIAKQLYPAQNIIHGDFTKQKFPNHFFDVAIGNPPFSQTVILADPDYKKHKFSLHDYFFAKTIDKVRPGGLLVFVTSRYTLDKQGDKARQYLAERADLVGAIRLPQTAFRQNAGTEVVTDVIFLRKRAEGEEAGGEAWTGLDEVQIGEKTQLINEYFVKHPEMVLGVHSTEGTQYAAESYTVKPLEGDIEQHFAEAVQKLPANVYSVLRQDAKEVKQIVAERDFNPKHKKEGGVYLADSGELMRVEFGSGVALESMAKLTDKERAWLTDYVGLRDLMKQARYDQFTDGSWEKSLKGLNRDYDAFVKKHGRLKEFTLSERKEVDEDGVETRVEYRRFKWQRLLGLDVEGPLLEALEMVTEDGEIVKAPFLKERTVAKPVRQAPQSMGDALALSLDEIGRLDLDHVADLMKVSRDEAIEALGDLVFETPEGRHELADEYLSGDVVTKLAEAEAAAQADGKYRRNVRALAEVQPKPLTPGQISAGLGMPWIPTEIVEEFAQEVLGINAGISRHGATNTWKVAMEAASSGGYRRRGKKPGAQSLRSATSEWGTAERGANEILDAVLNQRPIKITAVTEDKKTVTDPAATARVNEIADKMRAEFRSWVWTDAERAGELLELYNKKYNNLAPRRFDGSHLSLPGIATKYRLHAHQKRAIWRMIQTGNTYLAHAVGAGKTLEMIAAGMEMKRLGLVSKPLYVVPNDQLSQWAAEFMDAYPMANLMVADEENFHTKNRRRFMAQAAMNAPDAIIITHSALGKLRMKPESVAPVKARMLADLREALEEARDDESPRHLISKMEKMVEQAEQRFDSIVEDGKGDNLLTFEDLGADFLFVDEAHAFRKLDFTTVQQVKGIDPTGSRKALDLYLKTTWLAHQRPGRSHVFASGTPVTNTMGELYNVMRFFAEEQMERDDIGHFDAWAAMFGQTAVDYELNAAGRYEPVTRFAKFNNLPELMKRVRSFMDVLTSSNLSAFVKRPDVKGGGPENIVAPPSEALKAYQEKVLQPRMEATRKWKPSKEQPGNPDPIINIITDGRLSSIDMRYVQPGSKNDPDSKLNRVIDEIIRIHKLTKGNAYMEKGGKPSAVKGAAQVVFYNHGFGKDVAKNRGFDARAWINQRLKAAGIPASEVAWFDEYDTGAKQLAVLKDVREGRKRIIIGHARALGVGKNLQNRLYALHYIDPPWYPADVEQPHGRIVRQGNQHDEVVIQWYATKGSYDSTMWQMVGRKGRFIEQAFMGDDSLRSMEDLSEVSQYEMARALSSGDERIIKLVGLQAEVERLSRLKEAHYQAQAQMRGDRSSAQWYVETYKKQIEKLKAAEKAVGGYVSSSSFNGKVGKSAYAKPGEFGDAVVAAFGRAMENLAGENLDDKHLKAERVYGSVNGLPLVAQLRFDPMSSRPRGLNLVRVTEEVEQEIDELLLYPAGTDGSGLARRIMNRLNDVASSRARQEANLSEQEEKLKVLAKKIGAPFEHEQGFNEKVAELAQLQAELTAEGEKAPEAQAEEVKHSIASRTVLLGDSGLGKVSVTPFRALPFIRRTLEKENLEQVTVKGGNVDALREIAKHFGKTLVFFRERGAESAAAGRDAAVPVSPGPDGAGEMRRSERGVIGGFVHPGRPDLIYLNVDSPSHLLFVAGHELSHTLRMEDPELWKQMASELRPLIRKWGEYRAELADERYAALTEEEQFEELAGDVIGQNFLNELFWKEMAQADESLFKRIARRAVALLSKALRLLAGHRNVERYVADMEQARAIISKTLLAYGEKARAGMYEKFAAQADAGYLAQRLDGFELLEKLRAAGITDEMLGQALAGTRFAAEGKQDQTQTEAFKKWFGDSKVVDEQGRPLVVYHGTTTDVSTFNPFSHFGTATAAGARLEAFSPIGEGVNIIPVYLSIKKPLRIKDTGGDTFVDDLLTAAKVPRRERERIMRVLTDGDVPAFYDAAMVAIESRGFDGFEYINTIEDKGSVSYIPLRPEQIKSAIGNQGTFDPANPDIRFSIAPAAVKAFTAKLTPDKAGLLFKTLSGMVPERMKAAVGSVLSNPHYGSQKSKYRTAAYDLALERDANADEIKFEVMASQEGYEGLEGVREHYKKASKEEKAQIDKLLVEGDIKGKEYTEEDLAGGSNPLGRAVPEVVKKAYLAFRQTLAKSTATMFDRLGRLRLLPYEESPFYQELIALLDEGLSEEEVARRFGIEQKAVDAYLRIRAGRKKLDEVTKPYKEQPWYSTLRDALLKGLTGVQMQHEFGKTPDLMQAYFEIQKNGPLSIATAEKFQKAAWYKTLVDLLTVGDDHPMLRKLEIYNAYQGVKAYDSQLAKLKDQWRQAKGYLPRVRQDGEQHVKVFRLNDDGTYTEVWMQPAKTVFGAEKLREKVAANLKEYLPHSFDPEARYETVVEPNTATPEEIFLGIGSHRAIEALLSKVFDKATDAGIIENQLAVQQQVLSILADEISARGFGRHRIARAEHLIEGYETENTPALLAQFVGGMAGWLSKSEFAMRANKLMTQIPATVPHDKTWVREYVDDALKNSTYLDQWFGTARSFASLMLLGFKLSSPVLNSTQNYVWGQAVLSRHTKGATAKLLKAQHDVVKNHLLVKAGKTSILTDEENWALEQGSRRGRTNANFVRAMAGMDDTGGVMGRFQSSVRKLTEKAMIPFQAVETYWNREPMLLAAFRVFRAQGMEKEAALKQAEKMVDDAHFVMGKANIPALLRKMGPLGRSLYTFQGFTHNYLLGLFTALSRGEFAVVARSMTALALFGGLAAMPFGDDLDKWYRRIFGERPLRMLERWLRETAGEYTDFGDQITDFVLHGAPALAGVNFSNAMAVRVPWFSPEAESLAERFTGVWGGMAQKVWYAGDAAAKGDIYRAAEFMSPEALANILRAYRLYADGNTTLSGRPVFGSDGKQARYTAGESVIRAFGFMPLAPSKQAQDRWDARRAKEFWAERKADVLASFRITKDRKAAMQAVREFNRELREAPGGVLVPPITTDTLRQALRAKPDKREMRYLR